MNLHSETCIETFWNANRMKFIHEFVSKHIFLKRWQQINRFFHLVSTNTIHNNVFQKIDNFFEHLRTFFKLYWNIDTHLVVEEIIQRFMKKFSIIVNIFFKSESKNYKIWILINDDYVFDWLYHVKKNENFVNLNIVYTKKWKYSKIQIVIFDLLYWKNHEWLSFYCFEFRFSNNIHEVKTQKMCECQSANFNKNALILFSSSYINWFLDYFFAKIVFFNIFSQHSFVFSAQYFNEFSLKFSCKFFQR